MAYPPTLQTIIVTGTYINGDGTPSFGVVEFSTNVKLRSGTSTSVVQPGVQTAELDAAGHFSIVLPASNDPDWIPNPFTYTVTEKVSTRGVGVTYDVQIPFNAPGGTVDLSTLAPVPPVINPNIYVLQSQVGVANGVASLDATGKVPLAQLGNASSAYVQLTQVGAVNGVASLDSNANVPTGQLDNTVSYLQDTLYGYNGWAFYPEAISSGTGIVPTSGQIRASQVVCPTAKPVLGMVVNVILQATTPTNSFVALLDASGNRVAVSADISASMSTTGNKKLAFQASFTPTPGAIYYATYLFSGAPAPALARGSFGSSAIYNSSIATAPFRYNSGAGGQTSIPASITPSTFTVVNDPIWFGLYTA